MDRQTDRHTHTQTQTDFIICPMLYAIAMGQIITGDARPTRILLYHRRLSTTSCGERLYTTVFWILNLNSEGRSQT